MGLPPLMDRGMSPEAGGPESPYEIEESPDTDFEGGAQVTEHEDGSATIESMAELMQAQEMADIPFDANLAEHMDDSDLKTLASELVEAYEDDLHSRSDWEDAYTKGLDLLGINSEDRDQPFAGASGVVHPLISESVVQFQAQAYKELLPAAGPVKTKVVGDETPELTQAAGRVREFMNYQLTEVMEEYDPDLDQMLFYLPLSGSTFKKAYYDGVLGRPVSLFVPAQDLVVSYAATSLFNLDRMTHVLRKSDNYVVSLQLNGSFREVDLPDPSQTLEESTVTEKVAELEGMSRGLLDNSRVLLEMHVLLDLPGFEHMRNDNDEPDDDPEPSGLRLPYIVTLDRDSQEILRIERNWSEGDPLFRPIQFFTHYKFLPGLGFYGYGLLHMIGTLGRAATSILRQLIDAGTLANLPAGFKAKGVRVRDQDTPLQPGEWRDIDVPGGVLRDALMPLPYKEPSSTLAQLLGALVTDGRRFVSLADEQLSNMNAEAPVGTTVALLERGTKVLSAVHKRMHRAQKNEFRMLARIFAQNLPPEYPYNVTGGERSIKASDFGPEVDVLPVSDPNIFSMAQRVTLAQTQLQMAQSNPEIHDIKAAYRRMYEALEVRNIDELLPPDKEPQPMDPAIEGGLLLLGKAPQPFPQQNHMAHVESHILIYRLPIVQATPGAMGAIISHLLQHASMIARQQVDMELKQMTVQRGSEMGSQLAGQVAQGGINIQQFGQQLQGISQLPPPMDENQIEQRVAEVLKGIIGQITAALNPPQAGGEDPLVKIREMEVMLRGKELELKSSTEEQRRQLEVLKMRQKAATDAARIEAQLQIADDRSAVNLKRIAVQEEAVNASKFRPTSRRD